MKSVWHYILQEIRHRPVADLCSLGDGGHAINALMFLPALTKWNNLAVLGTRPRDCLTVAVL